MMDAKKLSSVDEIGMKILKELQINARSTFSQIGKKVGLSSPAVAERVYKMEEFGIISRYNTSIAPSALGHNIMALKRFFWIPLPCPVRRNSWLRFRFLFKRYEFFFYGNPSGELSVIGSFKERCCKGAGKEK